MKRISYIFFLVIFSAMILTGHAAADEYAKDTAVMKDSLLDSDLMVSEDLEIEEKTEDLFLKLDKQGIASYYTLGTNDVIEVTVNRHPELSGQYLVNSEGKIQYEFVGDVNVAGLTKRDLKEVLEGMLGEYVISPDVSIKIIGYNSKVVYVIGEVGNPGKIIMRGDSMTIREALIQAGLPLLTAKVTRASLMTPSEVGKAKKKRINLHKLLYEGDLRENYVMNPGDVLYVPPTIMAKTMRVIQPVAAPIGTAAGTGRTVTTGF